VVDAAGLPPDLCSKWPHLAGLTCLRLDAPVDLAPLLRCQLAVQAAGEESLAVTGVQTAGVIDALFAYDGPLGAVAAGHGGAVELRVWAPSAQRVALVLYTAAQGGEEAEVNMAAGERGVWSVRGPPSWAGCYYAYRVTAFHPSTARVETCVAPDPYARAAAANGRRTQLVLSLDAPELQPPGWQQLRKPPLAHACDAVLYELHVRDFSIADATVPETLRGTFGAFTLSDSAGGRHLRSLAAAGITHVHLLPVFDFGSVDERRDRWRSPDGLFDSLAPDSEAQQAAVMAVADSDGYNWGYDPVNWSVPEGSYCQQPDGSGRTRELREAVAALNGAGLRVVLDVVYNHVYGSGPASSAAVLDLIVPGYYLRRNEAGGVEASTCMNNTASEHAMCERLIVDDVLHWALSYKIDGFRFDLMGHLMRTTLLRIRAALDALTPESSGVDGTAILLYGEGWDYAEVAGGRMGPNASQEGMAGTGVATFNDRVREGAMGGGPFGDPRQQGTLTGLATVPAPDVEQGSAEEQAAALGRATERVLAGVAGNLRDFSFAGSDGELITGWDAGGAGSRCGYATSPCETVNYVAAHDNETLFDLIALKMSATASLDDRIRVTGLAQALLATSQGLPFFHAGDELLRSKSLDRDSYNSGDWFNALDWTGSRTGWGVGLPPAAKNAQHWHLQRPLLANPANAPSRDQALAAAERFRRWLRVRSSSLLFRLRTSEEVQARLSMLNRGPLATPAFLVWLLEDGDPALDPHHARILVGLNASQQGATLHLPALHGHEWRLHPELAGDEDCAAATCCGLSGELHLPRLTAAVFVVRR